MEERVLPGRNWKEGPYAGMTFCDSILDTIGNTPLVRLRSIGKDSPALILAKVESFNPGRSVKDRIGINIIERAERAGLLQPGGTIVESTSGNTGLGLAIAAAVKGYRCICTMPDKMSREKINLLKAVGARVVVCPTAVEPESPESYYSVARRLAKELPNAFLANQYYNPDNPESHYLTTGPEIWEATSGRITHFVASMGTGGTISGTGRYLKEKNPAVRVIGADPVGSILCEYFKTGKMGQAQSYLVEGIGEDIIPGTTHFQYIDGIYTITDRESFRYARQLSRREGILSGGSCGTAVAAVMKLLPELNENSVVVVILPDTGERYLSKVHSEEWLTDNGMLEADEVLVGDVVRMKRPLLPSLVTIRPDGTVRGALALIREHNISQIPVVDAENVVHGTITESTLMKSLLDRKISLEDPVTKIMEPPLPSVPADATVSRVLKIMAEQRNALLVEDGQRIMGILSHFDLIGFASR